MNQWIAKHLVYFPIQRMRGQKVKEYLPQVRAVQFQSLDEINSLRDEKLKSCVFRGILESIPLIAVNLELWARICIDGDPVGHDKVH